MLLSYPQQLATKEWQIKRGKILDRDKYTCQCAACKTPDNPVQVHHLHYIDGFLAWEYPDDMLLTLCNLCHANDSWRPILERQLAIAFLHKGFLMTDLMALAAKIMTDEKFTKSLLNILRRMQNG